MATIVPLNQIDPDLIEQLLDRSFGEDRHARTAYRIRDGVEWLPALSFAALDAEDYLAGTIQLWPIALTDPGGRQHPMLLLGPVAVLPELQGEGFGKALMFAALQAVEDLAGKAAPLPQAMIGDVEYYGRWGFTAAPTQGWHCPGPFDRARLLVRCTNPAVLPAEGMLGPWQGALAG